jgi:hypothetical protein
MARPEILRAVMLQIKLLSRMGRHVCWQTATNAVVKLVASTLTVVEYYNQKTEAESFSETLVPS